MLHNKSHDHLDTNTNSGFVLAVSLMLAILVSNIESFYKYYQSIINMPLMFGMAKLKIEISFIDLVNDGLMALFFLILGLEMKFHIVEGEYKNLKKLILPTTAAIGGFIVPALIYAYFNYGYDTINGWAVPIATDTAFVLCILSFFGNKIPLDLRIFVIGLSLIDDALAVIVLALFYTPSINVVALLLSVIFTGILVAMSFLNVKKYSSYLLVGILLWAAILEAGVHGTIAGIILAFVVPVKIDDTNISPNKKMEDLFSFLVHFIILPIFVFINSEVVISNLNINSLISNLSLGIIFGLFIGKQLGITLFSYIAIRSKLCVLPNFTSWVMFYGVAVLSGIGFTLSLFIGSLCFYEVEQVNTMRFAIIFASFLAAILGILVIKYERQICRLCPYLEASN